MNFRKFTTSNGKEVLCGKSAENNEELIKQIEEENIVLHTAKPGSPFCEIKAKGEKIEKKDIEEAAVICAKYSQDWRDNKKDVLIHIFKGRDIFKKGEMKLGTFGVKKVREIKVKKEEIEKFI